MRPRVRFRYERTNFVPAVVSDARTQGAADKMPLKSAESQSAWGICFPCLATTTMASFMQGARHFEPPVPFFALAHSAHSVLDLNPHSHCPVNVLQQMHCCRGLTCLLAAASLHALSRGDRLNGLAAMHASEKAAYDARLPVQTAGALASPRSVLGRARRSAPVAAHAIGL